MAENGDVANFTPTAKPKGRRPPEAYFSRCPLVFMILKIFKKTTNKKRKEMMNKGPATS